MKVTTEKNLDTTVAARIAGEDIARGDFVAVMNDIIEFPSFFWCSSPLTLAPDEPVRIRYLAYDAGLPYKVIGVCLPFVYVKSHKGSVRVLDTRKQHLVRLARDLARTVWKRLRASASKLRE